MNLPPTSVALTTIKGSAITRTESVRAGDYTIRKIGTIPLTPMSSPFVFHDYTVIGLGDGTRNEQAQLPL
jgi:hypothetical protein